MRRNDTVLSVLIAALSIAATPVAAQDAGKKTTAEQRLERAILLQDVERDLPGAIVALSALADDSSAPKDMRSKAMKRLVRALRSANRGDDAANALMNAVHMGLLTESESNALLRDDLVDPRLGERVKNAIRALLDAATKSSEPPGPQSPGFDDLIWIGEPAAPFVVEEIFARAGDLDTVGLLTNVVVRIGGESAATYLDQVATSKDALFRRAVVKALSGRPQKLWTEPLHTPFLKLAHDSDRAIRLDVVQRLSSNLSGEELGEFLEDVDLDVRLAALSSFAGRRLEKETDTTTLERVLRQALDGGDARHGHATAVLQSTEILRTQAGRDLYLELLKDAAQHPEWPTEWASQAAYHLQSMQVSGGAVKLTPIPAEQLVAIAEKFGPFEPVHRRSIRVLTPEEVRTGYVRAAIESLISSMLDSGGRMENNRVVFRDPWGVGERSSVYELLALGIRGALEGWADQHAKPEELPLIAEAIDRSGPGVLAGVVQKLAKEASPGVRSAASKPLIAYLERESGSTTGSEMERQQRAGELLLVCRALASLETLDGGAAIVAAVRAWPLNRPAFMKEAAQVASRNPGAFEDDDLIELATLPVDDPADSLVGTRWTLFDQLVNRGSERGIAALPSIYQQVKVAGQPFIQRLLAPRTLNAKPLPPSVEPDQVHDAITASLGPQTAPAWADVDSWVRSLDSSTLDDPRNRAGLTAVLEKLPECPQPAIRESVTRKVLQDHAARFEPFAMSALRSPQLRRIAIEYLRAPPSAALRPALEECLGDVDPTVVAKAIPFVASFQDERAAKLVLPLLENADSDVRRAAVGVLPILPIEDRSDRAIERLRDRDPAVRRAASNVLERLVEPRAVPHLVEMLRDEEVRDDAKAALEKIQFYVDQKARWDKLSAAGGLEATSAAAALLKQAAADKSKDVRVAAIASLGTLAVPETLPMLIGLMGDGDREVAVAAKAAVDRINAAAAARAAGAGKED